MTCEAHVRAKEYQARLCEECEWDRQQDEKRQRDARRERQRLRDRMALQFAVALLHTDGYDTPAEDLARNAYATADEMLRIRDEA